MHVSLPGSPAVHISLRYISRRATEGFRAAATNPEQATEALWKRAQEELSVVRRQSIVYGLYSRGIKNVLVGRACMQSHEGRTMQEGGA